MALGQLGYVGLKKETVWGTAATPPTNYLKFNTESLTLGIEELIEASLNARRDEGDSYEGLGGITGDTVHEVHPIDLGFFLRSALRSPITSDLTGSYRHMFQPITGKVVMSGTAAATTDGTKIINDVPFVPATNDIYNSCWVHVKTGTGLGAWGLITDTIAAAKQLTVATSPAAGVGATFDVVLGPENCMLPPYTIEVHRDLVGSTPAFQYKGMVINSQSFSFGTGAKILTVTNSWLGKDVANVASTTYSGPDTEPFRWNQAKISIGEAIAEIACTAANATTITLAAAGWTINAYVDDIVRITSGTGINQTRKIVSNTADTLTVTPTFSVAPVATDKFEVYNAFDLAENLEWSWDNGLVAVPVLNNTKQVGAIMGDAFRTTSLSSTFIVDNITDFSTYFSGWTTRPWVIWLLGGEITTNHYYEIEIEIPKVLFTAYPISLGGPGRITVGVTAKMKYDSTAGYAFKVRLNNNTSAY